MYDLLLLFTLQGLAAMWGDVFGAGEHRKCPTILDENCIFLHKTLVATVDEQIACENNCCDLTDS